MHLILKIMTVMLPLFDIIENDNDFNPANAILTEDNFAIRDELGNPLLTE